MMKYSLSKGKADESAVEGETATSRDQNHKVLKGALYLLERTKSASRDSFLLNGHRSSICKRLWPLILKIRCDKKEHVYRPVKLLDI